MRINIFILISLLNITAVFSQSRTELEAKKFFWGSSDQYKDSMKIPDKWKNESAVIIYKNVNYSFHKFGKAVNYTSSIRKRIKLLDKNAVKKYSEFSYEKKIYSEKGTRTLFKKKGETILGIKIIKPKGDEIIVDIKTDVITVDGESKIAISNLEVGDIIDLFIYKSEPFKTLDPFMFEPEEHTLSDEYPIMNFKLFFETENSFFVNFDSYNGAPELKIIPSEKNNLRRYQLTASNIDKRQEKRWFFPLVELPSYKFQVYFARFIKISRISTTFSKDDKIIKKRVSKEDVLDIYKTSFNKTFVDVGIVNSFLKNKNYKNDTEKVKAAYYYMRHNYFTKFIEAVIIDKAKIMDNPYSYYENSSFIQNQKEFINYFIKFLKQNKIPFEIVIAKKRYDGSIDDLLIKENMNFLVKVNTEKPLYASYFGPHTGISQLSPLLEETKVYLIKYTQNLIDSIYTGKLPISTCQENVSKKIISLNINDNFSGFNLNTTSAYNGHFKNDKQQNLLIFSDYVYEDYDKYGTKSFIDLIKKEKYKQTIGKEFEALKHKLKEKQKKEFETNAKSEYDLDEIKDYTYTIEQTGRYGFDTFFTYSENYSFDNSFIKKAGPNYIIEIGKFIGGQVDIKDKERNRKDNIYMYFPRSYNYTVKLKIPKGYTVSSLDKFNISVNNSAGAFISKTSIEDGTLTIETSKQYKHNFEPAENWGKMLEFLDAAFQFTHEKILLKKL